MEKEKVCVKDILAEGEGGFEIEYYLTVEEICGDGVFGMCMYGVEVVKTGGSELESAYAPSLSCDRREIMQLIEVISRLQVTPTTLFDVINDWSQSRLEKDFAPDGNAMTA